MVNKDRIMLRRWLTALIGIPITIWICVSNLWNGILGFLIILIASYILHTEVFFMIKKNKTLSYPFLLYSICSTLAVLLSYIYSINMINIIHLVSGQIILFFISFYFILGRELFQANNYSQSFEHIGILLVLYISIIILFPGFFIIKKVSPNYFGIFLLFLFGWISDAMGLFVGMKWGKTPLSFLPSKSKTLEGYCGSILFTIILGIICYYLQGILHFSFQWNLLKWILFGLLMSLCANFGDLSESLIKRWANVKDSGTLLPGMGGLFDTIDSQIFSTPVVIIFFLHQ